MITQTLYVSYKPSQQRTPYSKPFFGGESYLSFFFNFYIWLQVRSKTHNTITTKIQHSDTTIQIQNIVFKKNLSE